MQKKNIPFSKTRNSASWGRDCVPFGSNYVQLQGREWIIAGIILTAIFCLAPALWEKFEKFEPDHDYRLPYELGSDHWLYDRYCRWACSRYETLVVGDSVVWGHYVSRDSTLSHHLNENAGRNQFANLGVDGIHPVALAGLLRYYGRHITGKKVILHLNPLWMSSKKHDLQITKEFHFNHPRLIPQFTPNIPCYKDSYSKRMSAVVERYVAFLSWASHLQINYFESMDLPTWTLEHAYENPLRAVTLELTAPKDQGQDKPIPWTEKGTRRQNSPWVELETSLQWSFFQQSIELLKKRGNNVFVLAGPFNEHILEGKSVDTYQKMKSQIEVWLQQNEVPYYMPPVLPSEFYCDASHPLSEGYDMLAKQLFENQSFKSSILGSAARRQQRRP